MRAMAGWRLAAWRVPGKEVRTRFSAELPFSHSSHSSYSYAAAAASAAASARVQKASFGQSGKRRRTSPFKEEDEPDFYLNEDDGNWRPDTIKPNDDGANSPTGGVGTGRGKSGHRVASKNAVRILGADHPASRVRWSRTGPVVEGASDSKVGDFSGGGGGGTASGPGSVSIPVGLRGTEAGRSLRADEEAENSRRASRVAAEHGVDQLFQLMMRPSNYDEETQFLETTQYKNAEAFIRAANRPGKNVSDETIHYTMRAFAKRGSVQDAADVFEFWRRRKHESGSELRNTGAWTSLLTALVHAGDEEIVSFVGDIASSSANTALPALPNNTGIEWQAKTVVELKDELRSRSLKVSGSKTDLVARLVENDGRHEVAMSVPKRTGISALPPLPQPALLSHDSLELKGRSGIFPALVQRTRQHVAIASRQILTEMSRIGVTPDVWTYSSLMSLYGKARDFSGATALMGDIKAAGLVPDHVMFGALIQAAARAGEYERAWKLFNRLFQDDAMEPDEVTYNHMIWVCAKQGRAERARNLLDEMRQFNLKPNDVTYNTLLHVYARRRDFYTEAWRLMDEMQSQGFAPDPYALHTIMHAAARVGDVSSVERLADTILGVSPGIGRQDMRLGGGEAPKADRSAATPRLFSTILTAYANNTKMVREHAEFNISKAEEWIHRMRTEFNVPLTVYVANSLLMNYAAAGRLRRLEQRWCEIFGQYGQWIAPMNEQLREQALQREQEMGPAVDALGRSIPKKEIPRVDLTPEQELSMQYVSGESDVRRRVRHILRDALDAEVQDPSPAVQATDAAMKEPDEVRATKLHGRKAAVAALGVEERDVLFEMLGELEGAAEELHTEAIPPPGPFPSNEQLQPGLAAYTVLILAYANTRRVLAAKATFEQLIASGIEPDQRAYQTILLAYNKAGYLNSAMETVRIITQEKGWKLEMEDVHALLDRLRPYPRLELQVREMCGLVLPDRPKVGKKYAKKMQSRPITKWAQDEAFKQRNPDLHSVGFLRRKERRREVMRAKHERPHPGVFHRTQWDH